MKREERGKEETGKDKERKGRPRKGKRRRARTRTRTRGREGSYHGLFLDECFSGHTHTATLLFSSRLNTKHNNTCFYKHISSFCPLGSVVKGTHTPLPCGSDHCSLSSSLSPLVSSLLSLRVRIKGRRRRMDCYNQFVPWSLSASNRSERPISRSFLHPLRNRDRKKLLHSALTCQQKKKQGNGLKREGYKSRSLVAIPKNKKEVVCF